MSTFNVKNATTGATSTVQGVPYTGRQPGATTQFVDLTHDNLMIGGTAPNSFIYTNGPNSEIYMGGVWGDNVLDGASGSDLLVGGMGDNKFFVDDKNTNGSSPTIWDTISNFHQSDIIAVWGVTKGFNVKWVDGVGNPGYQGLTLEATAPGKPLTAVDIAGYTAADLTNGKLDMGYASSGGTPYLYVIGQ